jgi:2-polyprenyl-6-methoxyphenol hydroxylase-like FAD-dependent oxidoreductase
MGCAQGSLTDDMVERILVVGAGMAGLCAALSLAPRGFALTLLEKDAAPPAEGADAAFFDWNRRGVGHLRHSHAFLARLRNIIKQHHPALLAQLREAGCREIGFADMLPQRLKADYAPQAGDEDMTVLTSRRTTLEWVMRAYVETLPNVEVVSGAFVRGLIIEGGGEAALRVAGARGERDGAPTEWRADILIDAGGKMSSAIDQLIEAGADVAETCEDCGIFYYTRHYRLLPGQDEPPRNAAPGASDLGFIKYGLFPADNRCFSVTLAAPDIEEGLRRNLVRPEVFDRICALFPGIAPWTDPARAEPISQVFGMGDLKSRWRSLAPTTAQAPTGFFAVGDSLIRTNPLYGRGCSFAAVEAEILAGVLTDTAEPSARARLYDFRVKAELKPYFDDMRAQDRAAARRARNALDANYAPAWRERLTASLFDDGVRIALRADVGLIRAALCDFHMIEPPRAWMRRPENLAKVLGVWAKGRRRNAALYPPSPGPRRGEFMQSLGLAHDAASA